MNQSIQNLKKREVLRL